MVNDYFSNNVNFSLSSEALTALNKKLVPPSNSSIHTSDEDDYDDYEEDYGSSGEKYGWYNGFSDDVIDDAFEGDPSNTWNVD